MKPLSKTILGVQLSDGTVASQGRVWTNIQDFLNDVSVTLPGYNVQLLDADAANEAYWRCVANKKNGRG